MAIKRLAIENGYGQLELNNVAFRRDGRIEAQCALDSAFVGSTPCENGMLLAIDNVTRTVKFPASDGSDEFIGLNYTTEHMYDERATGLKDFKLEWREDGNYFYPRIGYLARGDKFTTNTICYDDSTYTSEADLKAAIASATSVSAASYLYGCECVNGAILIGAADSTKAVQLKVIAGTTMPNGTYGVKFQVL